MISRLLLILAAFASVAFGGQNLSVDTINGVAIDGGAGVIRLTKNGTVVTLNVSGTPVANTLTINGHALTSNVTLAKSDLGLGNVENAAASALYSLLAHTHTFASLTSRPTTIGGYGITDFNSLGDARWQPLDSDLTAIAALATDTFGRALLTKTDAASIRTYIGAGTSGFDGAFASLSGKPTTIAGYGITDFNPLGDARWSVLAHTHAFASLTSKPTTLGGYGITDGQATITFGANVQTSLGVAIGSAGAPVVFNGAAGTPSSLVGTNISGTAASLTAGNVTTNANQTGAITGTGNTNVLGSFTLAQLNAAVSDADVAKAGANSDLTSLSGTTAITGAGLTVTGNSTSAGNLTLQSTSHATKGFVYFGAAAASKYDETLESVSLATATASTGLQIYNTTDQTTNLERFGLFWGANVATIKSYAAGSGTTRDMQLIAGAETFTIRTGGSTSGMYQFASSSSGVAGNIGVNFSGFGSAATSGTNVGIKFSTTYNQTSGTGANTDLLINRTQTAVGSGAQTLADFQVGGTSKFKVDNTGVITIGGDAVCSTAGKGLQLKSGTSQRAGNCTLVGGTVTVTNASVTANTLLNLTRKTSGGTIGTAITYTLSAGASFTVNSDNPLDTSTFTYLLIELN